MKCEKHNVEMEEFLYQDGNSMSEDFICPLCSLLQTGVEQLISQAKYKIPVKEIIHSLLLYPIKSEQDIEHLVEKLNDLISYTEKATKSKIINLLK